MRRIEYTFIFLYTRDYFYYNMIDIVLNTFSLHLHLMVCFIIYLCTGQRKKTRCVQASVTKSSLTEPRGLQMAFGSLQKERG